MRSTPVPERLQVRFRPGTFVFTSQGAGVEAGRAALGPCADAFAMSQPPPALVQTATGAPVRLFEGIIPILQPLGGASKVIGTGFWIHQRGIFATARHVIEDLVDAPNATLRMAFVLHCRPDPGGSHLPWLASLRLIRHAVFVTDPNGPDVAIGFADNTAAPGGEALENYAFAYTTRHPAPGEMLSSYGYPRNAILEPGATIPSIAGTRVDGPLVRYTKRPEDKRFKYPRFEAAIPIAGGASGSPIFDRDGYVCAVASRGWEFLPGEDPLAYLLPMEFFLDLDLTELARQLGEDGRRTTLSQLLRQIA